MAVSKSCQSPSKAGWQHVAGTLFPARHLQQTPPRPCPAAEVDPQGRSVTMACRGGPRAAASCELLNSPAHRREGPRTISEIGDGDFEVRLLYAVIQSSSIKPPYSPACSLRRAATSTLQDAERDPSAACVQSWCLSSSLAHDPPARVFTSVSPAWRVGEFLFASHTRCLLML